MSEGNWVPKTFGEAVPYVTWGVLILGFGLESVAHLVNGDYAKAILAFGGMLTLCAAMIYWVKARDFARVEQNRRLVVVCLVVIAAIAPHPWVGGNRTPEVAVPDALIGSRVARWNEPASPWGGPLGPVASVEMVGLFKSLPKPCVLKITFAKDSALAGTILWLVQNANSVLENSNQALCEINSPDEVTSLFQDETTKTRPGITVHWLNENTDGERVALFFSRSAFNVSASHVLPTGSDPKTIWIEIGPGSPWKDKHD